MTEDDNFPGVPSPEMQAKILFSMIELTTKTSHANIASIKIMQALIQDLAANDPAIVDRLKRVFKITPIEPDIMPSVDLILSGITRPDDPNALHEDDMTAPKH